MRAWIIAMESEAKAIRPLVKVEDCLYVCGIGKVNAAMATQRAIDDGADEIINAGLCGGFGDDVKIGQVYEVTSAVEYDFDLAQLNNTRVGQLNERDTPYIPMCASGTYPGKMLATGDRFNDSRADDDLILSELKCELRDMEGAAIAHVCEKNGVKCRAYKCVSDVALGGESMLGQYHEHQALALTALSRMNIQ